MNEHSRPAAALPADLATERRMATAIRVLTMDAVEAANSGHPGMPMGMADVAAALFNRFVKIDPADPDWPDRDRVVLSAGHGSMLLYAVHHMLGYRDMTADALRNFRQLGFPTAGHPEYGHAEGVEMTTGPLGQGVATAVGMAMAEKMMAARFGPDLVDHRTWVLAGDGCLMEGISHEAIDFAGRHRLSKLTLLWDDNRITIDGDVALSSAMDQPARFRAAGWHAVECDGHDPADIAAAIEEAMADPRPTLIACRTEIGHGAPTKAGGPGVHGSPLGAQEVAAAKQAMGWTLPPFAVPRDILDAWRNIAARGAAARAGWAARLAASPYAKSFAAAHDAPDAGAIRAAVRALSARHAKDLPKMATRVASQKALDVLAAAIPNLVGGSADLTGSNNTKAEGMRDVTPGDPSGSYLNYGIREHFMAAAMNGIALHKGLIPYGGTFLAFADYARPAIRLGALMGVRAVHVMTHDSIGLGEDGPTHQPVEQIASLRAMPNLHVYRPADGVEAAEAWELALTEPATPSVLCLSRQALPTVRADGSPENRSARGAYVLRDTDGDRDVTLVATGSEVAIALEAADLLAATGVKAAVVSAPCFERFAAEDPEYQVATLGFAPRVGVEAGVEQGWGKLLGHNSTFVGMTGFGASAPAPDLYRHFGITARRVADAARDLIA